MTTTAVRPVQFRDWQLWNAAKAAPADAPACGGVYLLAHSHTGVKPERASPENLPREVVYIGVSNNLGMRPIRGTHTGVKDYHDKIDGTNERLFVATAPLFETGCEDYAVQRIYAEYVEAWLIWMFTKQHGYPPVLHYDQKGHNAPEVRVVIKALRGDP
jgi:hypothetical protein